MYAEASREFEAVLESGITGLVGTITVKVIDNDGGEPIPSTTTNITEVGTTGIYVWNAPAAPATVGQYTIVWSTAGAYSADAVSIEELVVVSAVVMPPTIPSPDTEPSTVGPCTSWLTGDDVAECCASAVADVGTMTVLLDDAADIASQLLYELSGRRWVGLCSREGVRPCHGDCSCGWQVLSRGHLVTPYDCSNYCLGGSCWCRDLSRARLSGHVRQITEVKIDGIVINPTEYRVDEHKWLTRLNGERWPRCARADLADTEEGTFSVSYTYGVTPPLAGVEAAKQLACQVYGWCSGSSGGSSADCQIPAGAVRITRQGITIERALFARNPNTGAWETGLSAVDYFLNAYNPDGLKRRALFFGPGSRMRHARPVG